MKGLIAKKGGAYYAVLSMGYDPVTGKRLRKWIPVEGNKKQRETRLAELVHQFDSGTFVNPGRASLAEFLERWLKDYAKPNVAPRTYEGYEHIITGHLIPKLGSIKLTGLKPEHIQHYYAEKLASGRHDGSGGLSPRTVRHHHVTLHGALESAIKWGLISHNPLDAVDPPRYQAREMHTFDANTLYSFLETAKSSPYYTLFHLALFTGMRRSELLALRWNDIDLDLGHISVTRTLHHLRDGKTIFRAPKSAKGKRLVALPPSAILTLKGHREKQKAECILLGRPWDECGLVFSQSDGSPLLPDTITHAWVKLVRRSGFQGIRLHDCRHSHASLLLAQGVHPKIVQERLGHASIQLTLDTYSHVAPGLQEAAARRFDEFLKKPQADKKKGAFGKVG